MTSFAFIMGVIPLIVASGAGAEMRHVMGVAVFSGMLGVTFFGLFSHRSFTYSCVGTSTDEPRLPNRSLAIPRKSLTASRPYVHGDQSWCRARRAAPMHKVSIALALFLAACAGPAYRTAEVPVPTTYNVNPSRALAVNAAAYPPWQDASTPAVQISSSSAAAPFWVQLGDTTLVMLVREAQRSNLDVHVAESRLLSARASRRLSRFDLVPTVTGTGSTSRLQTSLAATPGLTRQLPTQQLWDVGFDASWEVDVFRRVANNVNARSALAESSQRDLEDVQIVVAAEVARTYFDLRGTQRQLAVAQRNAANQQKIVKLTEDRLTAGRGTAFDTERAKSVLYLTLASTPLLEAQIALERNRLAVLVGRAPDALPAALLDSGALPRLPRHCLRRLTGRAHSPASRCTARGETARGAVIFCWSRARGVPPSRHV